MLKSKIDELAEIIQESNKHPKIDKEIIVYGFTMAIVQVLSIAITIALGTIFGLMLESLVFLASFSLIRMYAGGYHCKKAIHCYCMSSGIVVGVLGVLKITPTMYMLPVSVIILIISVPIIIKLAPIESPSKPLDEVEQIHYRKKTIYNLSIECCVVTILYGIELYRFAFVICLGIMVSACTTLAQHQIKNKIQENNKKKFEQL